MRRSLGRQKCVYRIRDENGQLGILQVHGGGDVEGESADRRERDARAWQQIIASRSGAMLVSDTDDRLAVVAQHSLEASRRPDGRPPTFITRIVGLGLEDDEVLARRPDV